MVALSLRSFWRRAIFSRMQSVLMHPHGPSCARLCICHDSILPCRYLSSSVSFGSDWIIAPDSAPRGLNSLFRIQPLAPLQRGVRNNIFSFDAHVDPDVPMAVEKVLVNTTDRPKACSEKLLSSAPLVRMQVPF